MEHDAALATLRQNLDSVDTDVAHEVYHPDAVLEFPQSGERFEGPRRPWEVDQDE